MKAKQAKQKILLKLQEDEIKKLRQELEQERNKVHYIKSQLEEIGAKESRIESRGQFNWGIVIIIIGITFMFLWGLGIFNTPVLFSWTPGLFAFGVIGIGSVCMAGALFGEG